MLYVHITFWDFFCLDLTKSTVQPVVIDYTANKNLQCLLSENDCRLLKSLQNKRGLSKIAKPNLAHLLKTAFLGLIRTSVILSSSNLGNDVLHK